MASPTREDLEAAAKRRTETSDKIAFSGAPKRLIVAGPGTGKTYNFRRALNEVGGNGLALTFIRALVRDLEEDLGDLANVRHCTPTASTSRTSSPSTGSRGGLSITRRF